MALAPLHGVNGLIYISGNQVLGANAWNIAVSYDNAQGGAFGDTWKTTKGGLRGWTVSITALHDTGAALLYQAATAGTTATVVVYPTRSTLTRYWSGSAIFSYKANADTGSLVGESVDGTGDGTLTWTPA